jgi:hypothetical protein
VALRNAMKLSSLSVLVGLAVLLGGASRAGAAEEAIDSRYKPFAPDPLMGDWQGGGYVAQLVVVDPAKPDAYEALVFRAFDVPNDKPLATLRGQRDGAQVKLTGDGWSGTAAAGKLALQHGGENVALQRAARTPPTLGAKAPAGAIVLFDGRSLDAFANKKGKDWLTADGPAPWKIVDGALEVVPGTGGGIITQQKFGDCRVHVEFRSLGAPTNSGVYLQTRYEVNINETYGKLAGTANGGLDNCSDVKPAIRASRAPLEWQTLDIEFVAPRFDAAGKKTANARATVLLNGVKLYEGQELNPPKGAAGRLGEAPTGPLMLQEHGMPVQFRNIWVAQK